MDIIEIQGHYQEALESLARAHFEFVAGDILKGSDTIWQAAANAVTAVALQRGWPINEEHESLHRAANRLANEQRDPQLSAQFSLAQKFLANSWNEFMDDYEIARDRLAVGLFVNRVLSLLELELLLGRE